MSTKKKFQAVLLLLAIGCGRTSQRVITDYSEYQFDKQVIAKVSIYDSLFQCISANHSRFLQNKPENESYYAFRNNSPEDHRHLIAIIPKDEMIKINKYLNMLGLQLIDGFDVFKDSSIKIRIRQRFFQKDQLEVIENLSYYPPGRSFKKRDPPSKDTSLSQQLQYWIDFGERTLFD